MYTLSYSLNHIFPCFEQFVTVWHDGVGAYELKCKDIKIHVSE